MVAVLHQKDVQHLARPDQSSSNTIHKKEYQISSSQFVNVHTGSIFILGSNTLFWLSNASLNWGSCLKFWKISSLFLLIMKRHFRLSWSHFLIKDNHKDIPNFSKYHQILHSKKIHHIQNHTVVTFCTKLHHCSNIALLCNVNLFWNSVGLWVRMQSNPWCRLTMCVWLPFSSKQPCEVWLGRCHGQVWQRLNYQQLRGSALQWQFSFSCLTSGTLSEMDTGQLLSLDTGYPKLKAASLPTKLAIYGSLKNQRKSSWTQPESQCKIHIIRKTCHYLVASIKQHF